jgi:hypothetical protein
VAKTPPQLDSVLEKIRRANKQAKDLEVEIGEFAVSSAHQVVAEKDPDGTEHRWRVHFNPKPDSVRWGVLLGEILHDLRSALNHLAWQLVLVNGRTPNRRTEFPIFKDRYRFVKDAPAKTRGMSPSVLTKIESLQSYNSGRDKAESNALWLLHELNAQDKHRLVLPLVLGLAESTVGVPAGYDFEVSDFVEDGAVALTIWPPSPMPKVDMKADMTFEIGIEVGERKFRLVQVLNEASNDVDSAFRLFREEF